MISPGPPPPKKPQNPLFKALRFTMPETYDPPTPNIVAMRARKLSLPVHQIDPPSTTIPTRRRIKRIPPEILMKILAFLVTPTTRHNPHLYACLQVSRTFHDCAVPLLWRSPRIGTKVSPRAWRGFVRAVKGHGGLINEVEDVWLVMNGEDYAEEDRDPSEIESETTVTVPTTATNGLEKPTLTAKRDSGISLSETLAATSASPFSLAAAMHHMLSNARNLQILRLQLYSDIPLGLPWSHTLPTLVHLEIRMRVTDDTIATLLAGSRGFDDVATAPHLKRIKFHTASLSNAAVGRLAIHAPLLDDVTIVQVPVTGGRYGGITTLHHDLHRRHHQSLSPEILSALSRTHANLVHLHVSPLVDTRRRHLERLPVSLRSLTVTLSSDVTVRHVATVVLPALPCLTRLCLAGPPSPTTTLADEEDIVGLPGEGGEKRHPALRNVAVTGCELVRRGSQGLREVYGVNGTPWLADDFVGRWRKLWPDVQLSVAS
ncbi:hypothetical protein HKX48_001477 [Thoreauomyces humboldtii]|nr:hypothetical protein HKX48_001477 [Thoreauomyces humboldtii]